MRLPASSFAVGWRAILTRPLSAAAIALVLGLGVGALTAVFSLSDPFLFKPLPYADPERLYVIRPSRNPESAMSWLRPARPQPTLEDLQARIDLFESVAAYRWVAPQRISVRGEAVALNAPEVSPSFFDVLGMPFRLPTSSTDGSGGNVAIALTRAAYARATGDHAGTNSTPGQISVLPESFVFPHDRHGHRADGVMPWGGGTSSRAGETAIDGVTLIARLKAGVSGRALQDGLRRAYPDSGVARAEVLPIDDYMRRSHRALALGALAASGFLLIVCLGNCVNLLVVRWTFRAREFATREALGASRRDILVLMLSELLIVIAGGCAVGVAMAFASVGLGGQAMPAEFVRLGVPSVDGRALLFACLASGSLLTTGLAPAWTAWAARHLKDDGRSMQAAQRPIRALRWGMAAAQCAMATVLLSGAFLLLRSYVTLTTQDTGVSGEVVAVTVSYPPEQKGARLEADIESTLAGLRHVAGVRSAAAAVGPMMDGSRSYVQVSVGGAMVAVALKAVTPGYFETIGTRVIRGRALHPADRGRGVVVNEAFAAMLPSGAPLIGRLVSSPRPSEVVGLVQNSFDSALDTPQEPTVYVVMERPWDDCVGVCNGRVHYLVQTTGLADGVASQARRLVSRLTPTAAVVSVSSLRDRLRGTITDRSFAAIVLSLFSASSLAVTLAGVAGVVAFVVARRTREIAVRLALGASRPRVIGLVVREAVTAGVAGSAAGLAFSRWAAASLDSLVYGVPAADWPSALAMSGAVVAVSLGAATAASLRALSVSPSQALRAD